MKKKIKLLIGLISLLTTSCNQNKILVDDFSIKDAKKYAKIYLKENIKNEDLNGKFLSYVLYFGKVANKYHVFTLEYGSNNLLDGIKIENDLIEHIEDLDFTWKVRYDLFKGRVFINEHIYSLSEAYSLNLITYNELKEYNKVYKNNMKDYYKDYIYKFENKIE